MGLSVLHNDIFPITFTRHVLKFLLGRKIGWHDLAFFDPTQFESMRKTIVAATANGSSTFSEWGLSFKVDLPDWMGAASVSLLPDGEKVAVTPENVHQYVELYTQQLLVESMRSVPAEACIYLPLSWRIDGILIVIGPSIAET